MFRDIDEEVFARNLSYYIEQAELTEREFGEKLRENNFDFIEQGIPKSHARLSETSLIKIAKVLDISVKDLFEE